MEKLMAQIISPKYHMKLVDNVAQALNAEYISDEQITYYIEKWHIDNYEPRGFNNDYWENFSIKKDQNKIDLVGTLHAMDSEILLKIAIDLGIETPDFIPSIPTFRNELKSDYATAYNTFEKAYRQIENDPSLAIGLSNSALESIVKHILKDQNIVRNLNGGETLYTLINIIIKEFKLSNDELPSEIKTIIRSLTAVCQSVEKLRSEKTNFHGKTADDVVIDNSIYTYLVLNSVATVGLFLSSYYRILHPKQKEEWPTIDTDENFELPF
ncbi:abortive infection family protein [Dyadobacter sp. CY347]|uniref:abortive infection family protein n=1 Tax=Dyadobacter sp. CY347 TaxID=2909336 RepID=UPI001F25862E|nr:abortive infection family protein [Dyadobacter sp. CY347]MCF2489922.1 abortive infection family protein [Dyadobacter sp. CY347]